MQGAFPSLKGRQPLKFAVAGRPSTGGVGRKQKERVEEQEEQREEGHLHRECSVCGMWWEVMLLQSIGINCFCAVDDRTRIDNRCVCACDVC